jgi:hypothetical protein
MNTLNTTAIVWFYRTLLVTIQVAIISSLALLVVTSAGLL